MGKPTDPSDPLADDAHSLRTNPGAGGSSISHDLGGFDDDAPQLDDFPPLYSAIGEDESSAPLLDQQGSQQTAHTHTTMPAAYFAPPNAVSPKFQNEKTGAECYMDRRLDEDPELLESHVSAWAQRPPRYWVQVLGQHQEMVEEHGKKQRRAVTDFDVRVDLTPYLYSNASSRTSWREVRTVDNGEKARRGTVFRQRAPGTKQDIEVGGGGKPTLREWCHVYCASHAGLKVFALQRRVVGFDEECVRHSLEQLVRSTNYRGSLEVKFPVQDKSVEVFNECATNRWRLTQWVRILVFVTLTFLFTWPYLFFRTKRFEVVFADWPFSRPAPGGRKEYVSINEDQWYNLWARAIQKGVLEKRQCVLDQQDLINSQGATGPTFNLAGLPAPLGFIQAGVNAMNEVNRQLGWGGDHF